MVKEFVGAALAILVPCVAWAGTDPDLAACSSGLDGDVAACARVIASGRGTGVVAAAHVFKARAEDRVGDDRAALADYDAAVDLQPDQPAWLRARALHSYASGDLRAALADKAREVAISPSPDALCMKGNIEGRVGDYGAEAIDARAALAMPGAGMTCHKALAHAMLGLRDYDGAAREVDAMVATAPDDADVVDLRRSLGHR